MPKALLLDTCAVLWLAQGSRNLRPKVKSRIDGAPRVLVSAITAWEISLKVARDELELPESPEDWFPAVIAEHDLEVVPLTPEILMAANRLPWHHRDPADRFIIASAAIRRIPVVTADTKFHAYDIEILF